MSWGAVYENTRKNTLPDAGLGVGTDLFLRLRRRWLNGHQIDVEDQRAARPDVALAEIAIGEVGGDEQFPFRSRRHELQGFRPALDDTGEGKGNRLALGVGTVEFLPIDERAPVMTEHLVLERRLRAGAGGDDLVLQSAR